MNRVFIRTLLAGFLVFPILTLVASANEAIPKRDLQAAWGDFILGLNAAQHSLTDPRDYPPPVSDRNLAEGYRYLLGHIGRMIELEMRMDPRFPEFHRSMDMLRKWTAENPDAMYLKAPLDDTGYYRVTGSVADAREWRDSSRGSQVSKAPRMVTFQTITDVPGSTGELQEMASCQSQTLAFLNAFNLELNDKRFEILIGPERPEGHQGNFLPTRRQLECKATGKMEVRKARWLSVREIFSDWEYEQALDLDIVRLDSVGAAKPAITADFVAEKLGKIGRELPNQIRFWNLLQEFPLEMRGDSNGDGRRNLPVNGVNPPEVPFTAAGVAGARQYYASGIFDLEPEEALVVKVTSPVEPHYIGMQLGTPWFEGPDQQNYVSSLSGHQLPVASDGSRYYVISATDPGVQGWVSTTGYAYGQHALRFIFRQEPPAGQMATTEARLVKLSDLASVLPKDTPTVDAQQRRDEVAIRQAHIKARWRGF